MTGQAARDAPLDLDALWDRAARYAFDAQVDIEDLIAYCRALEAALRELLTIPHDTDMDGVHRGFFEPQRRPCAACAARDRAAAILVGAAAPPGAPEGET